MTHVYVCTMIVLPRAYICMIASTYCDDITCVCHMLFFVYITDNINRARLRPTGVTGGGYINASFVDVSSPPLE